ncbi:pyridoxal phosphate-dependent aminotransferase [Roseiterribacter gracilis]|uniref:aspartate transaminase n=1 Tax=Roseiterribacter gracilis TaxID=2812848 RepID=A0A8S8X5N5_9PROT|nr:aspartate aminotransferase [Rhodospirillales bacterium TMPK1]
MIDVAARMHRLGTEGAFEVLAKAQALAATGKSIVNLCIGQPDFPPPSHVIEAAEKAWRDGHHGYTPAPGILPLREAVAGDLHRRFNVQVDPGDITVTPGSKVALFFALQILGEPGTEIIHPNPAYPGYESLISYSGATPIPIPLIEERGFSFEADDILTRIGPRTRAIILNSPANPTGGVIDRGELDKLVAGLADFPHVVVISDEIYGRIIYDGKAHHTLLSYESIRDRLILLDGWSKGFAMTGWRLGYAVWPKVLVEHANRLAINCHSCVANAVQYGGIAALEGPMDEVNAMNAAFEQRRHVIVDRLNSLPGISCVNPAGAFYAFPNIKHTGFNAAVLQRQLLEQEGVAGLAGTSFGVWGEGYLRFSYAASIEQIEEAMARVGRFLDRNAVRRPAALRS